MLYTRGGEKSIEGVGFLVNKSTEGLVVQYERKSSRVALLTMKINSKCQLQVVQVYAPTSSHDDEAGRGVL